MLRLTRIVALRQPMRNKIKLNRIAPDSKKIAKIHS